MRTTQTPLRSKLIIADLKAYVAIAAILILLSGCDSSQETIAQTVKESMNESFASDANYSKYHLTVTSVDVVHKGGNTYKGIAHVTHKGANHDIGVDITSDGKQVMWEAPLGAFLFAAEDEFNKGLEDAEKDIKNALHALDK